MAVDVRPTYAAKLRNALRSVATFWLLVPAFIVVTELSVSRHRWDTFMLVAGLLAVVPTVSALFWAAHAADLPAKNLTWREVGLTTAVASAVIIGLAVLPYVRFVYVHVGTAIVRVDRLTGAQCTAPFYGVDCGYSAPYDPIVRYDERTKTWKASPDGKTIRDLRD